MVQEIVERIEKKEEEERRREIEESKYNELYKDIMTVDIPAYLQEKRSKRERSLIARF